MVVSNDGVVARHVAIVGIGALGSHLVPLLRNVHAELTVIDFDRVEKRNLRSQFYGEASIGKTKANALSDLMALLWGQFVHKLPHRLLETNAQQLLSGSDLILDCLDNLEARTLVSQVAKQLNIPCLHTALAADGAMGRILWDEQFAIDAEAVGEATCAQGDHLAFIALVAAYAAQSVKVFLESGAKLGWYVYPRGGSTLFS